MRVLVFGGRNFRNTAFVYRHLDRLWKEMAFDVVIEGDAPGVDRMAGYWARLKRLDNLKFPADWHDLTQPDARIMTGRNGVQYDANAGPRRNQRMIVEGRPHNGIAFPGGKGTADMKERLQRAGIEIIEVKL